MRYTSPVRLSLSLSLSLSLPPSLSSSLSPLPPSLPPPLSPAMQLSITVCTIQGCLVKPQSGLTDTSKKYHKLVYQLSSLLVIIISLPSSLMTFLSCMKPLKGARPVPGPTIMTGQLGRKGRRRLEWRMKMGTRTSGTPDETTRKHINNQFH